MKLKLLALAPMLAVSLLRGDANTTLSQQEVEDLVIWAQGGDFDRPLPECFWTKTCRPDDYYSPYERFQPRSRYNDRPYYGPRQPGSRWPYGPQPPLLRNEPHRGPAFEPPRPPYYGEPL